jgi:spermidine synthase
LFALPLLGLIRQGALLGAFFAGLSVLTPRVAARFALNTPLTLGHPLVALAPFAALLALLGAGPLVSLPDIREHAGEIVYALDGPRGHHVVSKLQGGLVLFSNQVVATTSVDAPRFAEALVHPALAIAPSRESVLVLDDAAGSVEREILRWPDVTRVTLVPTDPALERVARASSAFRELGGAALADARLRVETTEPAVFVLRDRARYTVILANLADPIGYLQGKYYTVRFFEALRERLAPGGVFALQLTSPERTPRTHASILATLREAGFTTLAYRAPLPTLGEWGFALAVATEPGTSSLAERVRAARFIPAGTALVTARNLWALFEAPRSAAPLDESANYSYHQALLELYHDEEQRLSE